MLSIKLELDTLKDESKDLLEDALNDEKLLAKINEVLENEKMVLNITREPNDIIKIEEVKLNKTEDVIKNEKVKEKDSKTVKFIKSFLKVSESFFDTFAKNFLKKKFKINNSVYNDGKKAVVAIQNKDAKTFWKKATDSILNLFKKIPADAKKIIKNTKNTAIDEIYAWNT